MAAKKTARAAPTRRALTIRQLCAAKPKPKPAKFDCDGIICDAAWIIAVSSDDGNVDDLLYDLEQWQAELQEIVDTHGTDLTLGQLGGSEIEQERRWQQERIAARKGAV